MRIIWTNEVDTSPEGIAEFRKDCDGAKHFDDDAITSLMFQSNADWLDDEKSNLDIPTENPIIAVASLGLWDGRKNAYRMLGNNIREVLSCHLGDSVTYYADGHNVRCKDVHHDGENRYVFRELREGVDPQKLLDAILSGKPVTSTLLYRYTRSILPQVADVYGWSCSTKRSKP